MHGALYNTTIRALLHARLRDRTVVTNEQTDSEKKKFRDISRTRKEKKVHYTRPISITVYIYIYQYWYRHLPKTFAKVYSPKQNPKESLDSRITRRVKSKI